MEEAAERARYASGLKDPKGNTKTSTSAKTQDEAMVKLNSAEVSDKEELANILSAAALKEDEKHAFNMFIANNHYKKNMTLHPAASAIITEACSAPQDCDLPEVLKRAAFATSVAGMRTITWRT